MIASGEKTAPPLILLHGSGSNAVSWAGDVAQYSLSFRVYAVDIPGEPGKSAEKRFPWDGPAYAEWLEDILDELQINKTTLLGLSQGGWIAIKFAVCDPERVDKLVLLAPGGIVPTKVSFILAAILFPAVIIARADGQIAKCLAHQRQLVGSLLMYTQDYSGRLPNCCYTRYTATPGHPLTGPYIPYVKSTEILRCQKNGIRSRRHRTPEEMTKFIFPTSGIVSISSGSCRRRRRTSRP